LRELRRLYDSVDGDFNGMLDREEVAECVSKFYKTERQTRPLSAMLEESAACFVEFAAEGSETINFETFVMMCSSGRCMYRFTAGVRDEMRRLLIEEEAECGAVGRCLRYIADIKAKDDRHSEETGIALLESAVNFRDLEAEVAANQEANEQVKTDLDVAIAEAKRYKQESEDLEAQFRDLQKSALESAEKFARAAEEHTNRELTALREEEEAQRESLEQEIAKLKEEAATATSQSQEDRTSVLKLRADGEREAQALSDLVKIHAAVVKDVEKWKLTAEEAQREKRCCADELAAATERLLQLHLENKELSTKHIDCCAQIEQVKAATKAILEAQAQAHTTEGAKAEVDLKATIIRHEGEIVNLKTEASQVLEKAVRDAQEEAAEKLKTVVATSLHEAEVIAAKKLETALSSAQRQSEYHAKMIVTAKEKAEAEVVVAQAEVVKEVEAKTALMKLLEGLKGELAVEMQRFAEAALAFQEKLAAAMSDAASALTAQTKQSQAVLLEAQEAAAATLNATKKQARDEAATAESEMKVQHATATEAANTQQARTLENFKAEAAMEASQQVKAAVEVIRQEMEIKAKENAERARVQAEKDTKARVDTAATSAKEKAEAKSEAMLQAGLSASEAKLVSALEAHQKAEQAAQIKEAAAVASVEAELQTRSQEVTRAVESQLVTEEELKAKEVEIKEASKKALEDEKCMKNALEEAKKDLASMQEALQTEQDAKRKSEEERRKSENALSCTVEEAKRSAKEAEVDRIAADRAAERQLGEEKRQRVAEREALAKEMNERWEERLEHEAREMRNMARQLEDATELVKRTENSKLIAEESMNETKKTAEAELKAAVLTNATLLDAANKTVVTEVEEERDNEIKRLQGLLRQAQASLETTRRDNDSARSTTAIDTQTRMEELEEELKACKTNQKQKLQTMEEEYADLQAQLHRAELKSRVLAHESESFKGHSDDLESQLRANEDQREALRSDIGSVRKELKITTEEREEARRQMKNEISSAKIEMNSQQAKFVAESGESLMERGKQNSKDQARSALEIELLNSKEGTEDLTRQLKMAKEENDTARAEMKLQQESFAADIKKAEAASHAKMEAALAAEKAEAEVVRGREDVAAVLVEVEKVTSTRITQACLASKTEAKADAEAKMQVKVAANAAMAAPHQATEAKLEALRIRTEASAASNIAILEAKYREQLLLCEEDLNGQIKSTEARAKHQAETSRVALDASTEELKQIKQERVAMRTELRRLQDIQAAHQDVAAREAMIQRLKDDLSKQQAEEETSQARSALESSSQTEKCACTVGATASTSVPRGPRVLESQIESLRAQNKVLQAISAAHSLRKQQVEQDLERATEDVKRHMKQLEQAGLAIEIETASAHTSGQQVLRWQNEAQEAQKREESWRFKASQANLENDRLEQALHTAVLEMAAEADSRYARATKERVAKERVAMAKAESISREMEELRARVEAAQHEKRSLAMDAEERNVLHEGEVCEFQASILMHVEDAAEAREEVRCIKEQLASREHEVDALRQTEKGLVLELEYYLEEARSERHSIRMRHLTEATCTNAPVVSEDAVAPRGLPSRFDTAGNLHTFHTAAWGPRRGSRTEGSAGSARPPSWSVPR